MKDLLEYVTVTITSAVGPSCMDLALRSATEPALSQLEEAACAALASHHSAADSATDDSAMDDSAFKQSRSADADALQVQLAPLRQQLMEKATQEVSSLLRYDVPVACMDSCSR